MSSTELEGSVKDSRGGAMAGGYGRATRAIQDLLGLRASVNPKRCAYFVYFSSFLACVLHNMGIYFWRYGSSMLEFDNGM